MAKLKIIHQNQRVQRFVEDLNGVPLDMILIPPGSFIMGAPATEEESRDNERPQHLVKISLFFLGRYPITQAQWKAVAQMQRVRRELEENPSSFKGDNRPVENVTWYDAIEFCARLSTHTGKQYRLPSESEWEYAARAVNNYQSSVENKDLTVEEWNEKCNQPFNFGETISTDLANYNGSDPKYGVYGRGERGEYRQQTTEVDFFGVANDFGLSDMHGNVWEWCADPWHDSYEGAPEDGRVWDKKNKNENHYQYIEESIDLLLKDYRTHVLRGGSWVRYPRDCRSACRSNNFPDIRISYGSGFLVACGVAGI